MVPKVNKRGNRGVTLGYTPSNSTVRLYGRGGIAEPTIMAGTQRYLPLFIQMSKLALKLGVLGSFPPPFSNVDGIFADRPKFAAAIGEGNIVECLTIGTYVHDLAHVVEFQDILAEHLDCENCHHPTWDVAVVSWKTFFCDRLGRNVTVFFVANSRKSISESLQRRHGIGAAADELLLRFDRHPDHLKYVSRASLCPLDYPGKYRVTPIHFEQTVDISPLLFHLFKIRDWLWSSMSKKISKYLCDEIVYAFSLTNNRYRFHLFCDHFLKRWRRTGSYPIPKNSTFVGEFVCFLFQRYGCWGGSTTKNGNSEGAIRFQCTLNLPLLKLSKLRSLRNMTHTFDGMDSRGPSESSFKTVVKLLNDGVANSGTLLNQKSIYAAAGFGRVSSTNWLQHSVPGSGLHQKRLAEAPFFFRRSDQVLQLGHCLAAKGDRNGRMNGAKVDEVMCTTLKSSSLDSMYKDVVIKGCDLFFPSNEGANLRLMRVEAATGETVAVLTGGFESIPHAHYIPRWAGFSDLKECCGLEVYMANEKNYVFNVKEQSQKKLDAVPIHLFENRFEFGDVQILLNKNHFLAMREPICVAAEYLRIEPPQLVNALTTFQTSSGGWMATVDEALMNTLPIEKGFVSILRTKVSRRPLVGMKRSDQDLWCYETEGMAIWAIVLHILFNVRMTFKNHWCKRFLTNTKEFALLLPVTPTFDKCIVVCVVYRSGGKIFLKQFQKHNCQAMPPVSIGKFFTLDDTSHDRLRGKQKMVK